MKQDPQSARCNCKCSIAGRALGAMLVLGVVAALAFYAGRETVSGGSAGAGAKLAAQAGDDIPTLYPR